MTKPTDFDGLKDALIDYASAWNEVYTTATNAKHGALFEDFPKDLKQDNAVAVLHAIGRFCKAHDRVATALTDSAIAAIEQANADNKRTVPAIPFENHSRLSLEGQALYAKWSNPGRPHATFTRQLFDCIADLSSMARTLPQDLKACHDRRPDIDLTHRVSEWAAYIALHPRLDVTAAHAGIRAELAQAMAIVAPSPSTKPNGCAVDMKARAWRQLIITKDSPRGIRVRFPNAPMGAKTGGQSGRVFDCVDLGLAHSQANNKKPKRAFEYLLAILNAGSLPVNVGNVKPDTLRRRIRELNSALCDAFGIAEEPITYRNSTEHGPEYVPAFQTEGRYQNLTDEYL